MKDRKAYLSYVNYKTREISYVLTHHYYYSMSRTRAINISHKNGFTKVTTNAGLELLVSSRHVSHKDVLAKLGYEFTIDPLRIETFTPTALEICLEELSKTGDDTSALWAELERREG